MENSSKQQLQYLISKSSNKEEDEILLQPSLHIGSGIHSPVPLKVLTIMNHWLKIPDDEFKEGCRKTYVIADAALLLDDIQDNSTLRRGSPTAHLMYGIQRTVLSSYFAISLAMQKYMHKAPEALPTLVDAILTSHQGQTVEIYWRDNYICPTEEDYIAMITMKTGSFINGSLCLMKDVKDKTTWMKFGNLLGAYLQIHDDYGNLRFQQYTKRKGFCEDLSEGKFSFPIIHAINSHPEDKRVYNIVKQRTTNLELKKTCVKILEEYGSFDYTERVLKELQVKLRQESDNMGGNPLLNVFLDETSIVAAKSKMHACA